MFRLLYTAIFNASWKFLETQCGDIHCIAWSPLAETIISYNCIYVLYRYILVSKNMVVYEHERLSNITFRHNVNYIKEAARLCKLQKKKKIKKNKKYQFGLTKT